MDGGACNASDSDSAGGDAVIDGDRCIKCSVSHGAAFVFHKFNASVLFLSFFILHFFHVFPFLTHETNNSLILFSCFFVMCVEMRYE